MKNEKKSLPLQSAGNDNSDFLEIGGMKFSSRLIIGTGKYGSPEIMVEAIKSSGTEIVTASIRRVDISNPQSDILKPLASLMPQLKILPNTSGAQNSDEAVRMARLARQILEATGTPPWVKLEITPDPRWLLPDGDETLKAAKILVKEGFIVLPYINADPVLARKLEDAGAAAVMPLGAPIGTNQGLRTIDLVKIILDSSGVPVIVDAGLGAPSDAALAMEIGVSAVMINTAIAASDSPCRMAHAFRLAVEAGREAYLAGLAPSSSDSASPSSRHEEWMLK